LLPVIDPNYSLEQMEKEGHGIDVGVTPLAFCGLASLEFYPGKDFPKLSHEAVLSHFVYNKRHITLEINKSGKPILVEYTKDFNTKEIDPMSVDFSKLNLLINLVSFKEDMLADAKKIITLWKDLYDRHYKISVRTRYDKYQTYINIVKLRKEQPNISIREIAKIIYPEEYKSLTQYSDKRYDVAPLIEKVKSNIKTCKELMNGGYKNIR
jgi:hypothetical protein